MPVFLLCILLTTAASLAAGQNFIRDVAETNVNQQYLIESVSLSGIELDSVAKIPVSLRSRLEALVGQKCDMATLADLSAEIRRELHFRTVSEHLIKGSAPDRVKVDFDAVGRDLSFDVSVPRVLYTSDQKVTGELDGTFGFHQNHLTFGVVSNGDELIERFTGMTARFDSAPLGTRKLHATVIFEDYHEEWNVATQDAAANTNLDLYHSRWNVAPQLTFVVAEPLTVSVGASFEQMEMGTPVGLATSGASRSANAATLLIHYGRKIENGPIPQRVEARYSLRVATRALGSTYAYARHMISFKYEAKVGRHTATSQVTAGAISGDAPLFERFALGTSSALTGWNRFQLDPLGGTRVVHNELTYGYKIGEGTIFGFYDTGALWQPGQQTLLRHSAGVGYKQGIFVLTTAFPIRNGRVEPVFLAGLNY
jgi:hypothetical protein